MWDLLLGKWEREFIRYLSISSYFVGFFLIVCERIFIGGVCDIFNNILFDY